MALPKILRHLIDRENPHSTPQVHTGSILIWPGATIPEGYLLCDGSRLQAEDYPELYAAIGKMYGGDEFSTFYLPDLTGRVAVGKSGETEFSTLGKSGGEKAHTLTVEEMPTHEHPMPRNYAFVDSVISGYNFASQADGVWNAAPANWAVAVGGSGAHNTLQPYLTLQYIIKI